MNSIKEVRPATGELSRSLILILAISCGMIISNLYYIQPLLAEIAETFSVSQVSMGFVVMLTQTGFALGMFFLLPLADLFEKKKLILIVLICAVGGLALIAAASSITVLATAAFAVGFCSILPHMIVPMAAQMSVPEKRGKTIGTVMSGLLIGILVSRTFSGLVGQHFGWRTVYVIATFLLAGLAIFLARVLPKSPPVKCFKYKDLYKTVARLIKTYPVLREAALNGAMMFAAYNAFWATMVFLLQGPPYYMGADVAGLFGLTGIAGVIAAPLVGRLADKRNPRFTVGMSIATVIASYLCLLFFGYQFAGLIAGVVLLDIGVQSCQVSNQSRVYALSDEYRNRNNMVYMVCFSLGGSIGAIAGSWFFSVLGWQGVCLFGLLTQAVAIINHLMHKKSASLSQKTRQA
jgi:predicted MFS family arabinose efflux permease